MEKVLGRKQNIRNEDWINAMQHIEDLVKKEELDTLVDQTVSEILEQTEGKKAAFAWSGGKDSLVLERVCTSGITLVGIRTAESLQRLQNIASMTKAGRTMTNKRQVFPIYDWTNNDVWLFLKREHVDIPEIYLYLWQSGSSKQQLRVSQFFSVDTARSLVKMNEYYPDLMERIIRREPNAYLAALYWDSEMFGRSTKGRRQMEKGSDTKDYKKELLTMFANMDVFFDTPHKRHIAERYRNFFMQVSTIATAEDFKHIYEGLISGDPKMRTFRALYHRIYGKYISKAKKMEDSKHGQ